jgi:hypothetical protein
MMVASMTGQSPMVSMSNRGLRVASLAAFLSVGGAALETRTTAAADPVAPKTDTIKKPVRSCGELPRASRAYKDCLAAEQRRDTAPAGSPGVKPVFSSR